MSNMYQSFTGSTRRPRQVNLSGRPSNPFAAMGGTLTGGPQAAIASAQQDRVQRQQQRDRRDASQRIQRVWRGHNARRKAFAGWRQIWDDQELQTSSDGSYPTPESSLSQLDRLLLFYSPKREPSDVKRLTWYGMRQMATAEKLQCSDGPWPRAYLRLQRACVAAIRVREKADEELDRATLILLGFSARRAKSMSRKDASAYYEALSSMEKVPNEPLQIALIAPLQASQEAYGGLATLLTKPLNSEMIDLLQSAVDPTSLFTVLSTLPRAQGDNRSRLWLLGNLICLCRFASSMAFTTTIAGLLGSLADDVDFESAPVELANIPFDADVLAELDTGLPLNSFLHTQITSLVNQQSIRNLLVQDESGSSPRILAAYALTLLRCFPRKADDIRMWLYLGPTRTSRSPATQYFWNAMRSSAVFSTVSRDSRSVVFTLRTSVAQKEDWTVILTFLELYTFLLKIMDDEEFMGREPGRRNSAIPISDVADLVTFLKNLGIAMYFNASELNETSESSTRGAGSLGIHFGSGAAIEVPKITESRPLILAGMPGMTIEYLKGLVTGLLRSIYERDSRRRFLSTDHWLMTSRFDMTAFIPGVVAEEESRHMVQDQDDLDVDLESDDEEGLNSPRRFAAAASVLRSQEMRARAQRKASRRRYLESVAPRLEILQNMPFLIPFTTRVEIFRQFVYLDQEKRRHGHVDPDTWRANMMFQPNATQHGLARHHAQIKRKSEFEDAYQQFYDLGADLKEPIQITFLDEFGLAEAGIDGGGVTKEFLTSVIDQAFDPSNNGLEKYFVENEEHYLLPNPTAIEDARIMLNDMGLKQSESRALIKQLLQKYEFLGRIIGKCLYEGILVDVSFAGFFLKKWALTGGTGAAPMESGYRANINDLRELDEGLYKGLLTLKNAADDVETLGLTFTVDDMIGPPDRKRVVERELVPNGGNMTVTNENRLLYISRMAWYRLQGQSAHQTNAFLKGLASIIQPSWLSMFNQSELQTLIGGAAAEINTTDLRRNTQYGGVYVLGDDGREHPTIKLFWRVLEALDDEDRRKVLKFVTSTPRGPLLGFSQLNPRFSIRDSGSDETRLPSTSTCVNLLKLPMYKSEKVLREKLLFAVRSGAGFDLS